MSDNDRKKVVDKLDEEMGSLRDDPNKFKIPVKKIEFGHPEKLVLGTDSIENMIADLTDQMKQDIYDYFHVTPDGVISGIHTFSGDVPTKAYHWSVCIMQNQLAIRSLIDNQAIRNLSLGITHIVTMLQTVSEGVKEKGTSAS